MEDVVGKDVVVVVFDPDMLEELVRNGRWGLDNEDDDLMLESEDVESG